MSVAAISQLGFSDDKVAELMAPPNAGAVVEGFGLPSTATTVTNVKAKVDEMLQKQGNIVMNYDSDQIENFDVRVQPIRFRPIDAPDGSKFSAGTQLNFKRRGDAVGNVDPTVEDGWIPMPIAGTLSPKWGASSTATLDFTKPSAAYGTDQFTPTQTYYKRLDDGTIVTITLSGYSDELKWKAATHQTVRIIVPGKSSDLTEANIAKAMEAVGVTKHGAPNEDDIRTVALRSALYMLSADPGLGSAVSGGDSSLNDIDNVAKRLADDYGITGEMFQTRTFPNGRVSMELTPAGVEVLMSKTDRKLMWHRFNDSVTTLESMFTQGELLPSVRRWESAIRGKGMSTDQDLNLKGGGDWLYFRKSSSDPETYHYSSGHFYTLPKVALRRTDFHAYDWDHWGSPAEYQPFEQGMKGSGNDEIDFRGGFDLSQGITVVGEVQYQGLIDTLKAKGRTEIAGIPIEDLIATPSTANGKMKALITRFAEEE
jgi:hypothetical protein